MKSFTDIEQSKKLAEILPPESADMWWNWFSDPFDEVNGGEYTTEPLLHKTVCYPEKVIPCWSLAALLNLLPSVITRNEKRMFLTLEKAGAYNLYYKSPDRLDELWETKEDAIDACYEIILKLHEKKQI